MDESISIRAITIGVSVLLAIATMTVVIMYYSTAKDTAQNTMKMGGRTEEYNKTIEDILAKANTGSYKLNGEDVKNLLNYYYGNSSVSISVKCKNIVDNGYTTYNNLTTSKDDYNTVMKLIISNGFFRLIKNSQNTDFKIDQLTE